MGWFDGFKRIKNPVRGSAQVVSATAAPDSATSGTCRMHLVVSVPGHASYAIEDEFMVKVKKWPGPGQTLPIEASGSDPTRFKILWDEVQDWDVGAAAAAQQLAEALNQQQPMPPLSPPPGQVSSSTVMVDGRSATPEEIARYEAMTGFDLDGDGRVGGGAVDRPGQADDRVAALERLAALRASGALNEAEFQNEKARILDA